VYAVILREPSISQLLNATVTSFSHKFQTL